MNIAAVKSIATQPVFQPVSPQAPAGAPGDKAASGFGEMLKGAVDSVDLAQQESAVSVQQLLSGSGQDILPVVQAVAKADMSFKLLIGVRNKVIEAYKQTMNMQI